MERQYTDPANDALAHVLDWGGLFVAVAALVFVLSLTIR
jgi:hypothetical protein